MIEGITANDRLNMASRCDKSHPTDMNGYSVYWMFTFATIATTAIVVKGSNKLLSHTRVRSANVQSDSKQLDFNQMYNFGI